MILDREKSQIRERVWRSLIESNICPPDAFGYIPDFVGAEEAAARLASTTQWHSMHSVMANPDRAQLPVRTRAIAEGKSLYVAVPKIATLKPFYFIEPLRSQPLPAEAVSSQVAAESSPTVGLDDMPPIGMVVCGSVALNRTGARLGKGAGYSDIEVALLIEAGLVTDRTTIVTTVHSLQVIDEQIPEGEHDFSVDLIITEKEVIASPRRRRPKGLIWSSMPPEKIAAIPILGERAKRAME